MFSGYKTVIINAVVILLAAIELAAEIDIAGADETAITAGVVAIGNLILRIVTKGPVGENRPVSRAYTEMLEDDVADLSDSLDLIEVEVDEARALLDD